MRVLDVVWLALLHTWKLGAIVMALALVAAIGLQVWFCLEARARERRAQKRWQMRRYRAQ